MKIKDFIFCTVYNIEGIKPIKKLTNKFGTVDKFYLINNSNLELFKKSLFYPQFKEKKQDDLVWLLNRYAVSIVNKSYLMNKFINRDNDFLLNPVHWTTQNVVSHSKTV